MYIHIYGIFKYKYTYRERCFFLLIEEIQIKSFKEMPFLTYWVGKNTKDWQAVGKQMLFYIADVVKTGTIL